MEKVRPRRRSPPLGPRSSTIVGNWWSWHEGREVDRGCGQWGQSLFLSPPHPHSLPLLAWSRFAGWQASCLVFCSGPCIRPPGSPARGASSPSPAWAMHYPRKIEGLMEVISTGGATPSRLRREGRDVLVGAFAHPEIWVYLRGPLELRRGLKHPPPGGLWTASTQDVEWQRPLSASPYHTLGTPGPRGRPQPPPALLKGFPLAVGRASSHTQPTPRLNASRPALEPVLQGPLFLDSPPTVGGGGAEPGPPGQEHRATPPLPRLQRPGGTNPCPAGPLLWEL